MSHYLKDPDATSDHAIDWTDYLDGRTIVASSWSVDPVETGGVAIVEASFDGGRTAVRLGGGIVGHAYRLANHVTLSTGGSDDRSLELRVEQR
ncbi:MAG TPA: hypothetical protein VGW40_02380 [Allosphingosinicella sp.]|nr:hypothetical protein [Allosphingosinicella sp.]